MIDNSGSESMLSNSLNQYSGLASLAGINLPSNFLSPYQASSVTDFWKRWHITLSNFLRDYLYFSLGGSKKSFTRCRC